MKDVKESAVQWTDWDSNRGCLKFDKVVRHSSSTEIIAANNIINVSYQENAMPAIHIKIYHTRVSNPLGQTSFITWINFATLFRVC